MSKIYGSTVGTTAPRADLSQKDETKTDFVNGKEAAVTVQIGIYDNEETLLSLSKPIEVPLKRSHHTILTGMFLMSEASGGVTINPDFDGEHNLIFP